MRVVSANLNGIRAAHRKGFFDWLDSSDTDILCVQETKAQQSQLNDEILQPAGYQSWLHDAEKKGYSGVAIYSRHQPDKVTVGLGRGWEDFDAEGRFIQADFGKLSVISLYLPSGSSSEERQARKFDFLDRFMPLLRKMRRSRRQYIICGDWNIAHKKIDIKNWRSNQKNSGFLPEERAWMDTLFDEVGMVDAFRVVNQEPDQYTWWSNRGRARENNVGWRIDYQVVSPSLRDRIRAADVYKEAWYSDHAPLILDYDLDLG